MDLKEGRRNWPLPQEVCGWGRQPEGDPRLCQVADTLKTKCQVVHCCLGLIPFCDLGTLLSVLACLSCTVGNEGVDLDPPWTHEKLRSTVSGDSLAGSSNHESPKQWACLRVRKNPPLSMGAPPSVAIWGRGWLDFFDIFLYLPQSGQGPEENENGGSFHPNLEAALGQPAGVPREERK